MKVFKDQNKNMINTKEIYNKTNVDNEEVRKKIKKLIKKKNYNLRDLSRNIKKNDAYLQQFLYRGTPKVLPEEYRYMLAELLDVDVNELIPNWLKDLSAKEQFFVLKNIENKIDNINKLSFSKDLLLNLDLLNIENFYYFQACKSDSPVITIVDVSIKKYINPDVYLLNDRNNYFLAFIELSKFGNDKLSVKPYCNDFSPFQINTDLLNITGKVLWKCSKIFSK